jgi:hypothetical protein
MQPLWRISSVETRETTLRAPLRWMIDELWLSNAEKSQVYQPQQL